MNRRWTPLALLVALIVVGVFATRALADDAPSALDQLTPQEREAVEAHVPGWAELSPERKERIALNVLRMRDLSEEDRARLRERVQELERRRGRGMGPVREGPPPHPGPDFRRRMEGRGRLMKAVGEAVWADLSEASRAAIQKALGRQGRRVVEMVFMRSLFTGLAEEKAKAGPITIDLPEDAPEELRRRVDAWTQQAEAGDGEARLRLAHLAVAEDLKRLTQRLEQDGPIDAEKLRAVGRALRERHPEVFARAKAELEQAASDEGALARWAERGHRRGGEGRGDPRERIARLLQALEEARPLLRHDEALRAHAEALEAALQKLLEDGGMRRGRPGGRESPRGPGRGGRRSGGPGGGEEK